MLGRKFWILTVTVLLASGNMAQSSNLTNVKMDDAIRSYNEHKYSQSLSQLRQLHIAGVCTDSVHYYMALNYQQLNQISSAKQEYQTVAKGKTPNLRANAQIALASLDRWSQHRSYEGNGNVFDRYSTVSSASSSKRYKPGNGSAKEITFDIPINATGGG